MGFFSSDEGADFQQIASMFSLNKTFNKRLPKLIEGQFDLADQFDDELRDRQFEASGEFNDQLAQQQLDFNEQFGGQIEDSLGSFNQQFQSDVDLFTGTARDQFNTGATGAERNIFDELIGRERDLQGKSLFGTGAAFDKFSQQVNFDDSRRQQQLNNFLTGINLENTRFNNSANFLGVPRFNPEAGLSSSFASMGSDPFGNAFNKNLQLASNQSSILGQEQPTASGFSQFIGAAGTLAGAAAPFVSAFAPLPIPSPQSAGFGPLGGGIFGGGQGF